MDAAIKTVYEPPISDAVRKESTARGVPLYLYDGAYHETVAYQSLDLLQRDRDELDKGKALDRLLTAHDGDRVRTRLSALVGVTGSSCSTSHSPCARATRARSTPCSTRCHSGLGTVRDGCAIVESRQRVPLPDHIWRSYPTARPAMSGRPPSSLHRVTSVEGSLHCGVSEAVHLCDGDLAIRQALAAAASAQRHGEQLARWSGLHLSAFASAARYDRLFMSASELYRSMLAGYDDEHGTELVRTAEALVNWHGDVKAIAEELHQHPNTVRYRMRKMKAVLGIPHEDDKVFINLLSLVFLPELG